MALAILDIDGTLVDTNYQHALAWFRAFREHGLVLPIWRIHRHIGMGGDQMVEALTDAETESTVGDAIRATEGDRYAEMISEVQAVRRASELIADLNDRGHTVVLASSAKLSEVEHYVDLLGAHDLVAGWTSSDDVKATKPEPDLVNAAIERAGGSPERSVMIGDSPWDIHAAHNANVETIAVMTGGFSRQELLDAGAVAVYESVADLCDAVPNSVLGSDPG